MTFFKALPLAFALCAAAALAPATASSALAQVTNIDVQWATSSIMMAGKRAGQVPGIKKVPSVGVIRLAHVQGRHSRLAGLQDHDPEERRRGCQAAAGPGGQPRDARGTGPQPRAAMAGGRRSDRFQRRAAPLHLLGAELVGRPISRPRPGGGRRPAAGRLPCPSLRESPSAHGGRAPPPTSAAHAPNSACRRPRRRSWRSPS